MKTKQSDSNRLTKTMSHILSDNSGKVGTPSGTRNKGPMKLTAENIKKLKPEATRYEIADIDIKGFSVRVSPSGVISYAVLYRNKFGRRVRYTIGKHGSITPDVAREAAKTKLAEVTLGKDPQAQKKQDREEGSIPTLKEFLEKQYFPWFESEFKAGTTRATFRQFSEFHKDKLDQITTWKLEKWRSKKLKGGIKKGTVNRYIAALKAAFNRAIDWGIKIENPVSVIKQYKEDPIPKTRFLEPDEEKRLRAALDAREDRIREERVSSNQWRDSRGYTRKPDLSDLHFADHLKPMVLLSINTGLRQGELFNLNWSEVDLGRCLITVLGTSSKTGATRHLPLNMEALNTLREWKNQQDKAAGHVFKGKEGNRFDNVRKSWGKLLEDAKVTDFRWHDIRHHFASKLVMAGVDLNTVRELLGHTDIKMTLRYAHLAHEHKADAVAKLVDGDNG